MAVVPLALRRTPLEVLATLAREPGAFLLDVPDETGRVTLLGCAPVAELSISAGSGGDVLATMQRFIAETPLVDSALPFPLAGGVVACLGYELGELAAHLPRRHPVPYGAYIDFGKAQLVANSPELFLRRRGRCVETQPIKGTRPRGDRPGRDAALVAELLADPKERAEHVMIVDLERNDLGRVCETGSVVVERYAAVESYPTVHHLVSTVAGRLRHDVGLADLLRATFPGGSITGAPKVRAMEIIRELEPWPRERYTGAFGFLDPRGDLELALAIRTATVSGGVVRYHAGGGIVADSDPERELAETWLKTAALRRALGDETDRSFELCSSG